MSIEIVVGKSKVIESLLKELGYQGRGLHELITQAGNSIDRDLSRACRKVASIRNKAVHEAGFYLSFQIMAEFNSAADYALAELKSLQAPRSSFRQTNPSHDIPQYTGPAYNRDSEKASETSSKPSKKDYFTAAASGAMVFGLWLWKEFN